MNILIALLLLLANYNNQNNTNSPSTANCTIITNDELGTNP